MLALSTTIHTAICIRKPSCSWQTRAALETRVTGQSRASKGTPFDSLRACACFLLPSYSNFVSKMHRFRDSATYWSKSAEKPTPLSFDAPCPANPRKYLHTPLNTPEYIHNREVHAELNVGCAVCGEGASQTDKAERRIPEHVYSGAHVWSRQQGSQ